MILSVKARHVEHALAVLGYTDTELAVLERLERRIDEGESKGDKDMEGDHLPEPWSRLGREVYPPPHQSPLPSPPRIRAEQTAHRRRYGFPNTFGRFHGC